MTTTAAAWRATNYVQEQPSFDDQLQISRRVDWRFLLPDPELGNVAYWGPQQSALVEALALHSRSLTLITQGQYGLQQYDTIVLHDPQVEYIPMMTQLVAPGGVLYLEAYGVLGSVRQGGRLHWPHHPVRLTTMLHSLGLGDSQLHWHWPDFDHCTRMIPFHDRAIVYSMTWTHTRRPGFLWGALARGLVRDGPLARLVPCYSVIGRRE